MVLGTGDWVDRRGGARVLPAAFVFFLVGSLWIYRSAFHGPFISDDIFYVARLGSQHALDWRLVIDAFDPTSDFKYSIANYAPLYLLVSRIEWALFGDDPFGYHLVNVVVHALNATLLVAWLLSSRISPRWALLGGAVFAFHPANVEAVAWISQLRTLLALAASIGALLCLRRRPGLATLLFAAALGFKASALFCLPAALALWWASTREAGDESRPGISLRWIGVWLLVFLLYAAPQFQGFYAMGRSEMVGYDDLTTHVRSVAAIGARYIAMAATSKGLSAFHSPVPVTSWSDPWWLVSLPMAAILLGRIVWTLRRHSEEAVYWLSALAAYGPISQIFPFYFGMGDRYLYFILPGLIGGVLMWREGIAEWLRLRPSGSGAERPAGSALELGLQVGVVCVVVLFALHSSARASLWQQESFLLVEASRRYPDGPVAHYVRATYAVEAEDYEAAVAELYRAVELGFFLNRNLLEDPYLVPLRSRPEFEPIRLEIVRRGLDHLQSRAVEDQGRMRSIAGSHFAMAEYEEAERALEEALRMDGPHREALLRELEVVRAKRRELGR